MVLVIALVSAVTPLLSAAAPARERVEVACGPAGAQVHPRRCLISGVNREAAWGVLLVGLRWSNWGGLKARSRGFILNPEEGARSAATVLLYGRMSCDGAAAYRSLRLGHQGHVVVHLGRLSCPS